MSLVPVIETTDDYYEIVIPPHFIDQGNEIPPGQYRVRHENSKVSQTGLAWFASKKGFGGHKLSSVECRPVRRSPRGSFEIQFFAMNWQDGKSVDAACQIVAIVPVSGYPRQSWEGEDIDTTKTPTL